MSTLLMDTNYTVIAAGTGRIVARCKTLKGAVRAWQRRGTEWFYIKNYTTGLRVTEAEIKEVA